MPQPHDDHHPHYRRLVRVLSYLADHWQDRPNLQQLANIAALSPDHFQRIFQEWVGLSPKQLLQILTHEHILSTMRQGKSLMDIAFDHGLSGSSRLHDLFVNIETMTPGQYQKQGQDMIIYYDLVDSPFGICLLAVHPNHKLSNLVFVDDGLDFQQAEHKAFEEVQSRWPLCKWVKNSDIIAPIANRIFLPMQSDHQKPLSLLLKGTDFQIKVWQALMSIPSGHLNSYGGIASMIKQPTAGQAVGQAVGKNPISWLIPCHRVLSYDGLLNGYRWGLPRKYAMLAHESAGYGIQLSKR